MNKVTIHVKNNINRFIKKCISLKYDLYDIKYLSEDEIYVDIDLKDYKVIKKANYYCDISIINYYGFNGIKLHIKKYLYCYLLFFFCFILMDVLTSYIVDINIIHENSTIRKLVKENLYDKGIKKYTLGYSFEELEKIKNEILKENPEYLEWMSITKKGMTYIVRIEDRIIPKKDEDTPIRHVVAKKDALITKIISTKGDVIVRSGDYVKKGDILISGEIKLYEEVKGNTSATGTVYGNVWYEVDVKIPKQKEINTDTGKSRYNLNINNKILLKNKYKYFRQEGTKELNILGLKILLYKELEYNKKVINLTDKNLENELNEKINEAFKEKLKGEGTIISKNVLKKEENNSTIDCRVFVVTNEVISSYQNYEVMIDDSPKSD